MNEYQKQIQEQSENYRFLLKAVTRKGFFELYFKSLPYHRTNIECFNALNDRYFDLVGEFRYSSYNSFRYQLNKQEINQ
ncbi:hypothetical protein ACOKFD_15695 [Flagellimonas sp. S174]|uniref:hypothetical protein n=1 Tax=Flagellimonas sp. S174 TaxID=3410790 RepID=UPI003BF4FEAD